MPHVTMPLAKAVMTRKYLSLPFPNHCREEMSIAGLTACLPLIKMAKVLPAVTLEAFR